MARRRILALGDSYTIGTGVDADERWVSKLADRLRDEGEPVADPVVIAENGWTTDDLDEGIDTAVAGTRSAVDGDAGVAGPFDLVTLLIGANNCFQGEPPAEFAPKFRAMLDRALGFAADPDSVVVLTVPDYTLTPVGRENDPDEHAERLERYNEIVRKEAGARGTRLVDVVPPSRAVVDRPDLIAGDDLHPAPAQHDLFLDRIGPVAREAIGD
ncbi:MULTISPECIES: SGNH/GDSL hydrolase family protein [Halolamina]|uniref:Lysophospholipase L1 n=1 Tax=Halolamina pelagica TaxID=699431 RepID=A0A1I5SJF9_9EURY|nr:MULTISPECIES: GDSL-type esterase/lipase family protein [Halolamina]NHX37046.1 SGNH/GDSL hydrolase family protein [Halolamina sp. R1-12]SFP70496.1 Lysophospholipase L1 [Halolamina pelagica]